MLANKIYNKLSIGFTEVQYNEALLMGMLSLDSLVDGKVYEGYCRNAVEATWRADIVMFTYLRAKFGSTFHESVPHPCKDTGFDVFVPTKEKD